MKLMLFKNMSISSERVEIHYHKDSELVMSLINTYNGYDATRIYQGKNHEGAFIDFEPQDVYYFESVDKKTFAYLKHDVLQITDNLSDAEYTYASYGFIRINKSCIVNLYQVKVIKPEINMRIKLELENGESLIINRGYKKAFDAFLEERITNYEEENSN
jgi:hypothetical protein